MHSQSCILFQLPDLVSDSDGLFWGSEGVKESLSLDKVVGKFVRELHIKLNIKVAASFRLLTIILTSNAFSLNLGYISGWNDLVDRNGELASVESEQTDRFALDHLSQTRAVFVDQIKRASARK